MKNGDRTKLQLVPCSVQDAKEFVRQFRAFVGLPEPSKSGSAPNAGQNQIRERGGNPWLTD